MKKTKSLMVIGTSSYAGKTLITAALCRIFRDQGYRVAPFKAQNMSLNSAVTEDRKEISRAQAMQALAAKTRATTSMNPILLKPRGDGTSQVILNGKPYMDLSAKDYYKSFVQTVGKPAVKKAIESLKKTYEIIVMEGAGSPAEINLYERDLANHYAAEIADADVILVADIERGGAFASIYGTLTLLKPVHRKKVKGIIINKFRGDKRLLTSGIKKIEKLVNVPVIGIVPFIEGLRLPQEDSQSLDVQKEDRIDIAVIRLPRISNYTDFDPLAFDPRIRLRYITDRKGIENPDAIIIPGTKSTVDDLRWMKKKGFTNLLDFKGKIPIIGVCGGFQILGKKIIDRGIEKKKESIHEGLGLLDIETIFGSYEKTTVQAEGQITLDKGIFKEMKGLRVKGYEIHMGKTRLLDGARPVFLVDEKNEGASDTAFMTFGTYLHGLFDEPEFREKFIRFVLKNSRANRKRTKRTVKADYYWEKDIKRVAGIIKKHVRLNWFYEN